MSYTNFYRSASQLADSIRSGSMEAPEDKQTHAGLAVRRGGGFGQGMAMADMETRQDEEAKMDYNQIMAEHIAAIRNDGEGISSELTQGLPVEGDLGKALEALAAIESSDNYSAVGPVVKSGSYKGDRAYGRYQVMGKNIPAWTKEILGTAMTIEQFVNDPVAQDTVAAARLQESYEKHGTWEDAASVWFSGRPLKGNTSSDGWNTVPQYVSKFQTQLRKL